MRHPQSVSSGFFVAAIFVLTLAFVSAFNDEEEIYKWSPSYLYRRPIYDPYSPSSPTKTSSFGRRYEGSLGSRNPGFLSYNTSPKRGISKDGGRCMSDGRVCLFRSGLVGAVMKLKCCEGSTCTLLGAKFVCVSDSILMAPNEYGEEPETIKIDPQDLSGWNEEIFGKKKK